MDKQRVLAVVAALLLVGVPVAHAQTESTGFAAQSEIPASDLTSMIGDGGLQLDATDSEPGLLGRLAERWPADLVVAPIPGRSPQIGWNLALAVGYFITGKSDEPDARSSVVGGFAMGAENGSYAYGLGTNLYLLDDRLRVKAGAAYADVRYRYYGSGLENNELGIGVDILQEMPLYFGSAAWNVWKRLYVGAGYLGGEVDSRLRFTTSNPFFDPSLVLDIGAWSLTLNWDSRDHDQFPRNGWFVDASTRFFRKSAGGDFDAETYKIAFNHYLPVRETDVLASRLLLRGTSEGAPFFLLSTFGGSKDLRGYPSGRYRDEMMYALQTEYRWQYSDSLIFTGFAGFGEVADSFGDMGGDFLPAAGIGARYVLSKKHKVSLSFDVAQGKHGTEYYFGVGEAF
jgi:outer membrane protein assembly factor BamA